MALVSPENSFPLTALVFDKTESVLDVDFREKDRGDENRNRGETEERTKKGKLK